MAESWSGLSPSIRGGTVDDRARIIGVWKLVSVVYEDQETKARTPVYGMHPVGYQLATPEGRWITVMTAEDRQIPQTEADRALALRSMIAYTGRWRLDDGKIKVKVEAAWQQAWVGTEQIREYRFDGDDRVNLEGPPQPHPNMLGKSVRIIVIWERDKS
jgi:hypothetical protein